MKIPKIKLDRAAIVANVIGGTICVLIEYGLHYLAG
ncbi:hypothetical protein ABIA33_004978 [Streptacidiphilus sp. MAP12-16]